MNTQFKTSRRLARARRTHTIARKSDKPRLVVYRSNTTIYALIVDDSTGKVVCSTSGLKLKDTGIAAAEKVGTAIAKLAQENKITTITFDRNGYKYHGQIKALADKAREGGLTF